MRISERVERLPLDDIRPHPNNSYSMDEAHVAELAESIRRDGLGQMPLVRRLDDGTYQMIAGHRRLAAYKLLRSEYGARWAKIPVNVVTDIDDVQAEMLLNTTNLQTRQLSNEERAEGMMRIAALLPETRKRRDDLKGLREEQAIAKLITEANPDSTVKAGTVQSVLRRERARRAAVAVAEGCAASLAGSWAEEARAGRAGADELRRIAALPEDSQRKLFVDYQREGGGKAALARVLRRITPTSSAEVDRLLTKVTGELKTLSDLARTGRTVDPRKAARVSELAAELHRLATRTRDEGLDWIVEAKRRIRQSDGTDLIG